MLGLDVFRDLLDRQLSRARPGMCPNTEWRQPPGLELADPGPVAAARAACERRGGAPARALPAASPSEDHGATR
eukprot:1330404-Alexandrium_andersonii.AAC.1